MTITTGTFDLTRSMPVPPSRLWHLLTDAKARENWGAPSDDHVLTVEASDLREGGAERHRCGPKEDPMFLVDTRWYKLMPGTSACYTETLHFGGEIASVSLATYRLTETAKGTDLSVTVAITSFTEDAPISEHEEGWNSGFDRLVRLASA
ncbi:SRPBCC domain-containing protein [Pseudaestuariivita sp.]|uniref:SRPBCC domain-containing protein n=1 Tax=Pseudaestuariivita sp. TaxID=2211669 RepID=UPI004057D370